MSRLHVGVAAIPNQCLHCGRFKPWAELITHFVPDTDYSSEDESWRECIPCHQKFSRNCRCEHCRCDLGEAQR